MKRLTRVEFCSILDLLKDMKRVRPKGRARFCIFFLIRKSRTMDNEMREGVEKPCEHEDACSCSTPDEGKSEGGSNEEISLAFLLALMPLVVLTFFGQVGLI